MYSSTDKKISSSLASASPFTTTAAPAPGNANANTTQHVVGKYELGKALAVGDFDCRTRLCTHIVTGAPYVVRIYAKAVLAEAAWMWERVRGSIHVQRTLPKHESIVEMTECFETHSSLFILMQLFPSTNLAALMKGGGSAQSTVSGERLLAAAAASTTATVTAAGAGAATAAKPYTRLQGGGGGGDGLGLYSHVSQTLSMAGGAGADPQQRLNALLSPTAPTFPSFDGHGDMENGIDHDNVKDNEPHSSRRRRRHNNHVPSDQRRHMKKKGLSVSAVRRVFEKVVRGVMHMHQHNVVHLGIAPDHVLVNLELGQVKISNLISCCFCPRGKRLTELRGTRHTVAPEVLRSEPYDPYLADAWSLGVLLYFMLNDGYYPHDGANTVKHILYNHIRPCKNSLPEDAKDLVARLLQPQPTERLTVEAITLHPFMQPPQQHQQQLTSALSPHSRHGHRHHGRDHYRRKSTSSGQKRTGYGDDEGSEPVTAVAIISAMGGNSNMTGVHSPCSRHSFRMGLDNVSVRTLLRSPGSSASHSGSMSGGSARGVGASGVSGRLGNCPQDISYMTGMPVSGSGHRPGEGFLSGSSDSESDYSGTYSDRGSSCRSSSYSDTGSSDNDDDNSRSSNSGDSCSDSDHVSCGKERMAALSRRLRSSNRPPHDGRQDRTQGRGCLSENSISRNGGSTSTEAPDDLTQPEQKEKEQQKQQQHRSQSSSSASRQPRRSGHNLSERKGSDTMGSPLRRSSTTFAGKDKTTRGKRAGGVGEGEGEGEDDVDEEEQQSLKTSSTNNNVLGCRTGSNVNASFFAGSGSAGGTAVHGATNVTHRTSDATGQKCRENRNSFLGFERVSGDFSTTHTSGTRGSQQQQQQQMLLASETSLRSPLSQLEYNHINNTDGSGTSQYPDGHRPQQQQQQMPPLLVKSSWDPATSTYLLQLAAHLPLEEQAARVIQFRYRQYRRQRHFHEDTQLLLARAAAIYSGGHSSGNAMGCNGASHGTFPSAVNGLSGILGSGGCGAFTLSGAVSPLSPRWSAAPASGTAATTATATAPTATIAIASTPAATTTMTTNTPVAMGLLNSSSRHPANIHNVNGGGGVFNFASSCRSEHSSLLAPASTAGHSQMQYHLLQQPQQQQQLREGGGWTDSRSNNNLHTVHGRSGGGDGGGFSGMSQGASWRAKAAAITGGTLSMSGSVGAKDTLQVGGSSPKTMLPSLPLRKAQWHGFADRSATAAAMTAAAATTTNAMATTIASSSSLGLLPSVALTHPQPHSHGPLVAVSPFHEECPVCHQSPLPKRRIHMTPYASTQYHYKNGTFADVEPEEEKNGT